VTNSPEKRRVLQTRPAIACVSRKLQQAIEQFTFSKVTVKYNNIDQFAAIFSQPRRHYRRRYYRRRFLKRLTFHITLGLF